MHRSAETRRPSTTVQDAELGLADAGRVHQHCLEYRLKFAGRAADDRSTSAVAVCCPSARQFARARLHLVEQPHVLDRDHRLVGKGGDEFDLLFGEWLDRCASRTMTPIGVPSRSSGTPSMVR